MDKLVFELVGTLEQLKRELEFAYTEEDKINIQSRIIEIEQFIYNIIGE